MYLQNKEQQMYTDRGFRVEEIAAGVVYSDKGNFSAEISAVWMDAVIKGRTSFVRISFTTYSTMSKIRHNVN